MIEIDRLHINTNNKDILNDYKYTLLKEEYLEESTTCNSYLYDIYKYMEYLESIKITNYSKINKDVIEGYLKKLDDEEYSIYSVVRKISSIKKFHHYLSKKYNICERQVRRIISS